MTRNNLQTFPFSEVLGWASPTGLSLNRSSIGDAMKSLGYDTHVIGKWHVGDCNDKYLPVNRGFDTFYGFVGAMTDYVTKVRHVPIQFMSFLLYSYG